MVNISNKRNINYKNFFDLAREIGILINKNIIVKEINKNNFGIFANDNINSDIILIDIPRKFVISKKVFKNFLLKNTIEYPNLEFLTLYSLSLPSLEFFKQNSFFFIDQHQREKILNLFIDQSPTKRKIIRLFEDFNKLDEIDKYIYLIFKSRAFRYGDESFLIPIMDMVNYKYGTPRAILNKDNFQFKNKNFLKISQEFFQGYSSNDNIVTFFLNYNFIPENFNTISLPKNFFSLNISQNSNQNKIDKDLWIIDNGKISNRRKIVFEDLEIPIDFRINIGKIFNGTSRVKKFIISILEMYKAEAKYSEIRKLLSDNTVTGSVHNFGKCIDINYSKVDKLIKNIEMQN